jgi:polysaccharide export outer membrane protein
MITRLIFVVICFSGLTLAQQPTDKSQDAKTPSANNLASNASEDDRNRYLIGPGDILDINILNRPNLSRQAVRVEGNGMIRMPLIDTEIRAACQTEGQLAKEIATRYLKYYRNPQVDVFVKEYHSRQVAIIGAVREPARFELQRRVRLLELLTYAKGPSERAGQTINIVRSPPPLTCPEATSEDLASAFSTYRLVDTLQGKPSANPYVEAGDIITIPEADQIYVVGNVLIPQTIALREPTTLSRAIAMAGGTKPDSKKDKVRIVRQAPGSQVKQELIVDLSAIEKKKAEDIMLMPNDIVDVPTSAGKTLLRSLLGSVAPTVTQLPVRVIAY